MNENSAYNAPETTGTPDPMLRGGRDDAVYQKPADRVEGEGVKTGPPHDHYVHLADGSVITGHAGGTHHHDAERGLIPVISVFPMGTTETE